MGDNGYVTFTVVRCNDRGEAIREMLSKHPDLMFAGSTAGVTEAAIAAGAEPGDWMPLDEEDDTLPCGCAAGYCTHLDTWARVEQFQEAGSTRGGDVLARSNPCT